MQRYEYKVMPAPARAEKIKGLKSTGERFAHGVSALMNEMAADGWEFMRAETLPCEEKKGFLRGSTTSQQSVFVFRRALPGAQAEQPAAPAPDARADPIPPAAPAAEPAGIGEPRPEPSEPPLTGSDSPPPRPNGPDTPAREPVLRAEKSVTSEPTRRLSLSLDDQEAKPSGAAPLTASRKPDGGER